MAPPVEFPEIQLTPYIITDDSETDASIDEAQVFLLERGNARGTAQERAAFALKLQADIRKIKSTLACMKLAGESPDAMRQAVTAQIVKLKASYEHFSSGTAQFIQAKSAVERRMDAFEEKVKRAPPPLPSAKEKTYAELFAESKSPLEMLSDDDFWKKGFRASEREYVTDAMDYVSVATAISKVVGAAIGKACTLHPKLEKGCEEGALVLKRGGEAVRDFLFTPEQLLIQQKNIEKDACLKEERLGIPKEAVKQFYADLPGVVVGAATGGILTSATAWIVKLRSSTTPGILLNFLKDESGAIPLVRKAYSRREMIKLFEEHGFNVIPGRGNGSHTIMKKEGFPKLAVIPIKKDVATGTAQFLLKLLNESIK